MYLYPMYFTDELIDVIAAQPQDRSVSRSAAAAHQRHHAAAHAAPRARARNRRRCWPSCAARFPTWCCGPRSSPAFRARPTSNSPSWSSLSRQQRFERLGVFTYSFEPDTPAARLPDHLDEEIKEDRRERLMAVQQEIAFDWNEAQVGRRLDVLLDRPVPGEKNAWIGRSYADAPDVDRSSTSPARSLRPGQFVPCEIVATRIMIWSASRSASRSLARERRRCTMRR